MGVYGRAFLVHDMDAFTRAWYERELGRSAAQLAALDVSQPGRAPAPAALPPHNGYGSAEDALQNCVRLVSHGPAAGHEF